MPFISALFILACPVHFGTTDPAKEFQIISQARAAALAKLREEKKPLTQELLNQITAESRTSAQAALNGVDLKAVDAAQGLDWARLADLAQNRAPVMGLLTKFIDTKPAPSLEYQASSLGLSYARQAGDTSKLFYFADHLPATTDSEKLRRASMLISYVAAAKMEHEGFEKGSKWLDELIASVASLKADAKLGAQATSLGLGAATQKIDWLEHNGRAQDAVKLIDATVAGLDPKLARTLLGKKTQLSIVGNPSPTFKPTEVIGDFAGLESLKGKIVVLDFFAHWCGPCKASFPDLRQLNADLNAKGVQIVHATTYYGYYGAEKGLSKEQEYKKMQDFVKENSLAWPVVFISRDDFAKFGVTAIPHCVLIDADGKVERVKIGYSKDTFAEFRKKIETMVAAAKKR